MKSTLALLLLVVLFASFAFSPTVQASGGDQYASLWKCSDGNTYGLVANGNKRQFFLPTLQAPIFFSGVKKGDSYSGTIYQGNQQLRVSGPVTNNNTRITLRASDGRTWILDFQSKPAKQPNLGKNRPVAPSGQENGQDEYASFWKCSDGNTYGLVASGNKRSLYLPSASAPIFFSGIKDGNSYRGIVYVGNQKVAVSGPITKNSTRVTLQAQDGRTWVLNYSHK